ncbi:MAG TPA: site-2 protease family protein [Bacillota bacterium]|jgi:Zn-dependent protease
MARLLDIRTLALTIPGLLIAFSFHEYAHARAATALGDDTPRLAGRLTLDPMAHLDPIGILLLLVAGFGWAKPVPINPLRLRGNMRRSSMLVALAGPATNLVLAFVFYLLTGIVIRVAPNLSPNVHDLLVLAAGLNVALAVFNLLPIPPLDGSWVLRALLPWEAARRYDELQRMGPVLLLILVATGGVSLILSPAVSFVNSLIATAAFAIAWL